MKLATLTRRVTASGRIGTSRSAVTSSRIGTECRWRIDGLAPGEYEVELFGPGGSGGAETFTLASGTNRDLQIPAASVRVVGTLRINGVAVERARLMFVPSQTTLETAIDGSFSLTLARAGDYRVFILGDSLFSQSAGALFEAGVNQWDHEISGGVATIDVVPSSSAGNLDLSIEWADGSFQGLRIPTGVTRLVKRGIPPGTYRVSLKREGARVSDTATVTIQDARSAVDIVLREVAR